MGEIEDDMCQRADHCLRISETISSIDRDLALVRALRKHSGGGPFDQQMFQFLAFEDLASLAVKLVVQMQDVKGILRDSRSMLEADYSVMPSEINSPAISEAGDTKFNGFVSAKPEPRQYPALSYSSKSTPEALRKLQEHSIDCVLAEAFSSSPQNQSSSGLNSVFTKPPAKELLNRESRLRASNRLYSSSLNLDASRSPPKQSASGSGLNSVFGKTPVQETKNPEYAFDSKKSQKQTAGRLNSVFDKAQMQEELCDAPQAANSDYSYSPYNKKSPKASSSNNSQPLNSVFDRPKPTINPQESQEAGQKTPRSSNLIIHNTTVNVANASPLATARYYFKSCGVASYSQNFDKIIDAQYEQISQDGKTCSVRCVMSSPSIVTRLLADTKLLMAEGANCFVTKDRTSEELEEHKRMVREKVEKINSELINVKRWSRRVSTGDYNSQSQR